MTAGSGRSRAQGVASPRIISDAASPLMHDTGADQPYRVPMSPAASDRAREFGYLIKDARERLGWSQDELADKAGVGRATAQRYERGDLGKTGFPDLAVARKLFKALGIDPREIAVVLGFVTREEIGLPPEPKRVFAPTIEEVIAILEDPKVSDEVKQEWIDYLKFRTRGRRQAG
jgi:transcriptional regulator with XRE-family HTH domain